MNQSKEPSFDVLSIRIFYKSLRPSVSKLYHKRGLLIKLSHVCNFRCVTVVRAFSALTPDHSERET